MQAADVSSRTAHFELQHAPRRPMTLQLVIGPGSTDETIWPPHHDRDLFETGLINQQVPPGGKIVDPRRVEPQPDPSRADGRRMLSRKYRRHRPRQHCSRRPEVPRSKPNGAGRSRPQAPASALCPLRTARPAAISLYVPRPTLAASPRRVGSPCFPNKLHGSARCYGLVPFLRRCAEARHLPQFP